MSSTTSNPTFPASKLFTCIKDAYMNEWWGEQA